MTKITVRKADLLKILVTNHGEHRKEFKANRLLYYETLGAVTEDIHNAVYDHIKFLKTDGLGNKERAHIQDLMDDYEELVENAPHDYSGHYISKIEMLEMDISKEVEMNDHEYNTYVEDNWSWKRHASESNLYLMKTSSKYKG